MPFQLAGSGWNQALAAGTETSSKASRWHPGKVSAPLTALGTDPRACPSRSVSSLWGQPGHILAFESLVSWEESRFQGCSPSQHLQSCFPAMDSQAYGVLTTHQPPLGVGWPEFERGFLGLGLLKGPGLHRGLPGLGPQCLCGCCPTQEAVSLPCQSYLSAGAQPPWSLLAQAAVACGIASATWGLPSAIPITGSKMSMGSLESQDQHSGFSFAIKLCDLRHMTDFSGPHCPFIPRRSHSCSLRPSGF